MAKPAGTPTEKASIYEQSRVAPTGVSDRTTPRSTFLPKSLAGTTFNAEDIIIDVITVTTPGTPAQLPNIPIPDGFDLVIRALRSNTGLVYLGRSRGEANRTTIDNWDMAKTEAISLRVVNANVLWIDADVGGEGVKLMCERLEP